MSKQFDDGTEDFAKRIHRALRAWHARHANDTLTDLLLARQKRTSQEAATPRLISNQTLLDGLECLKTVNARGAELLQRRFLDKETALEIAHRWNITEDMVFQRQREAIGQLAETIWQQEGQLRQQRLHHIEARLESRTYSHLLGVVEPMASVRAQLDLASAPWLIALEGLGGIGKTALANGLARDLALDGPFVDIAWVSAKQQAFLLAAGLQPTNQPALDIDTFVNTLLEQLDVDLPLTASAQAKLTALTKLLKDAPYLIIIDNLETALDYQALLPTLRKLVNPTKFLLTSRHSLQASPDVFCCALTELSRADTFALLKCEARLRGLAALTRANEEQLDSIYQVVGGNPLALKLVAGQLAIFPLPQVLAKLEEAQGKKIDDLYIYIYWQAWNALKATSQQVLLAMPLAQNGDFAQLMAVTQLDVTEVNDALEALVTLSLVEVGGNNLAERRYRIHRLTETFLLNEVSRW